MTKPKMQLFLSACFLLLSILMLVGTTVAYFTAQKQYSHTLTTGNVTIELTEAAVKNENGHLVKDESKDRVRGGGDVVVHDYGAVYPGMKIYKDPTIENTGTNEAWVAARITLTDGTGQLHKVIGYEGYDEIDLLSLLSGGALVAEQLLIGEWNGIEEVYFNDSFAMVQKADKARGEYHFYCFFLQPLAREQQVTVFEQLEIPADWNHAELQEVEALKITVTAYGVQLLDLDSCYQAMTLAFPEDFVMPTTN